MYWKALETLQSVLFIYFFYSNIYYKDFLKALAFIKCWSWGSNGIYWRGYLKSLLEFFFFF